MKMKTKNRDANLRSMGNPASWRQLIDGDLPGARNMARDVAILEAVAEGGSPPTLRLYGWSPPCLTLGRHQHLDAVDLGFCRDHGIDVVRRPTGGRALLHHLELTYSLAAPLGRGPIPRKLQDAYRTICDALVRACGAFGIDAQLTPGEINIALPGPSSAIPCFEVPAGGEVVVAMRKLIGSAMRSHGGAILHHGAILLDWDSELQAGALGLADDSALRPHITTFAEQLGQPPDRQELERAVVAAFSEHLGVRFAESVLAEPEAAREQALIDSFQIGAENSRGI
jgi:lipoate-protein ligase A